MSEGRTGLPRWHVSWFDFLMTNSSLPQENRFGWTAEDDATAREVIEQSTPQTYSEALDAAIAPALEAYGEEIKRHGRTFGVWPHCRCGWETDPAKSKRNAAVAVGVHVKMAMTRASKTYDKAVDDAIARISAEFDAREDAARRAR